MKKGFTMIELIFVIVILGILAAVAIPRLAATRDDAEVAKALTNITTTLNDITGYYTSQSEFSSLGAMSNVAGWGNTDTKPKAGETTIYPFKVGSESDCISLAIIQDSGLASISLFPTKAQKLLDAQKAVVAAEAAVKEAEKDTTAERDQKIANAKKTLEAAQKNQNEVNENTKLPDAKGACGSLINSSSFTTMRGKIYQVSGQGVKF